MPTLVTGIEPNSAQFLANAERNRALVQDLQTRIARAALGGGEKAREKHLGRGKLLPRERVAGLIDPGSPFLELGALAANGMYGDEAPGAGVIAGVGRVRGRHVLIIANDATVKGGVYFPMTVKKHLRARSRIENRLPCIYSSIAAALTSPTRLTSRGSQHFGRISTTRRRCPPRHTAGGLRRGIGRRAAPMCPQCLTAVIVRGKERSF
jgi:3-methylcrotonyl-CoA carboxylase beta subunit